MFSGCAYHLIRFVHRGSMFTWRDRRYYEDALMTWVRSVIWQLLCLLHELRELFEVLSVSSILWIVTLLTQKQLTTVVWAEWKLGNWPLLDRLWPMAGKELILEKRSWELFDSQWLSVLYCCCWWISLLSQWQSTLATWHFTLLYKTTIHRLHHAVTHRNALGFNHLFTIELWILAPLARSHWDTL